MIFPLALDDKTALFLAVATGFFFGLFLERSGLGDPRRLTGVFFLRDFAVPKVMFTTIVTAMSGLYLFADLSLFDMSQLEMVRTYFWPQLAGGAIFGLGFLVSGYCPGTAVAGFASGRLDAFVTMIGVCLGSLLFALLFPQLEPFYLSSAMGPATIHGFFGLNHWVVIAIVFALACLMFYGIRWIESKNNAK